MFRFIMPDPSVGLNTEERAEYIQLQIDNYLSSDSLANLCSLLNMDLSEICQEFDIRSQDNGNVKETQEIETNPRLEERRNDLFPIFRALGFIDINKPRIKNPDHIVILGGAYNACFDRTICGKKHLTDSVKSFDGLSCYRPINPLKEKTNPKFASSCETEFGALYDSFCAVLGNPSPFYYDDFRGDRHLHRISCIRSIEMFSGSQSCRIYAAPSSEPELRRANTSDSLAFYLDNAIIKPGSSILAITNNIYCNRQFLQLAHYLLQNNLVYDLDVIGCSSDHELSTVNTYNPSKYMQEFVGMIKLIHSIYH